MDTETELERFRRQWREEVSARPQPSSNNSRPERRRRSPSANQPPSSRAPAIPSSSLHGDQDSYLSPREYDGLGDKQHGRCVGDVNTPTTAKQPVTALEYYERAVQKESEGSLGESVNLYRKAFRLDESVYEKYNIRNIAQSNLHNHQPPAIKESLNPEQRSKVALDSSVEALLEQFRHASISAATVDEEALPSNPSTCYLAGLPNELISEILEHVALLDIASLGNLAQVCRSLAHFVMTEDRIWRRVVHESDTGFGSMIYRFTCSIKGENLAGGRRVPRLADDSQESGMGGPSVSISRPLQIPLEPPYTSYRHMMCTRPRVRFNGCYISTINYSRPGMASTNQTTWGQPILIVTYYRYLRLYPDGTAITLLSNVAPADVVPYFKKENLHKYSQKSLLPPAVMKDALTGRWRISGKGFAPAELDEHLPESPSQWRHEVVEDVLENPQELDNEAEGTLHIQTLGVTPAYLWKMAFGIASAGRKGGVRNNKLAWKGYWSYNIRTDDFARFELRNERAFYWSRVRSWN